MDRGIRKAAGQSKAPELRRRNVRQLNQRYKSLVESNRDLLRQDDPSKEDARDSMGQRFWENNFREEYWRHKIGYEQRTALFEGYRDRSAKPTYGYANRKYLYLYDVIPFYQRRWRKPPENPTALY